MTAIIGSTVLITGGASGIGYRLGRLLLERGAGHLVVWDVREDALAGAVAGLAARGARVDGFPVDVADPAQVRDALAAMRARGVAVDLLVNNAGIVVGREFADCTDEAIDRVMAVNALAPMRLTRALLPEMRVRGRGHVVNVASAAGMVSNPRMAVYCASKAALIAWSDALRLELDAARAGVRVTTVIPYYIDTGMFAGVRSPVIPILHAEPVARAIARAIREDRVVLHLPRLLRLVPLLRWLLPVRGFDLVLGRWLGVYRSMRTFRGGDAASRAR